MTKPTEPAATPVTTAWDDFCDGLKLAGREIISSNPDADDVTQAEALRYMTRMLRSGLERFVENWDPLDPLLAGVYNDRLKWGMDNPDSIYAIGPVDSRYEYEISGNVGTVPYFNFTGFEILTNSRQVTKSFLDGAAVRTDADGNFVVHLGGAERAENWMALPPGTNSVMLRETFAVRATETPISARIRLLTDTGPDQPATLATMAERLEQAGAFVLHTGRTFLKLAGIMGAAVNTLPEVDGPLMKTLGGDPNYFYYWSAFRVQPDEALLIQFPYIPECENWGLCLYNSWLESLDYTRAPILLGKFTAVANDDGSVTLVIAHHKPDGGNWLSTCGHVDGNIMLRWTRAQENVAPRTRLVRLAGIDWPSALRRWNEPA